MHVRILSHTAPFPNPMPCLPGNICNKLLFFGSCSSARQDSLVLLITLPRARYWVSKTGHVGLLGMSSIKLLFPRWRHNAFKEDQESRQGEQMLQEPAWHLQRPAAAA